MKNVKIDKPNLAKKRDGDALSQEKQSKKVKVDVFEEKRAFLADFGTNLPPKELFGEGVSIEIEWDSAGRKLLSAEIESHDSLFKFEGKEDHLEKCYIGIFNKETNQLDLVPADYFQLHSSGPHKNSETLNETQLRMKLEKQNNLVGYNSIKKSMCSKFSTQKYARMQINTEQQTIKKSDIEEFGQKLFNDIAESDEKFVTSAYTLVRDTKTNLTSEIYNLDDYLTTTLVDLVRADFSGNKIDSIPSKERIEMINAKAASFRSVLLREFVKEKMKSDIGKKALSRTAVISQILYLESMITLIKNFPSAKNHFAWKNEGPVLYSFAEHYLTDRSTTYHEVKLHMDAIILVLVLMNFAVEAPLIAKDFNLPLEKVKTYLYQIGCSNEGARHVLTAPVKEARIKSYMGKRNVK